MLMLKVTPINAELVKAELKSVQHFLNLSITLEQFFSLCQKSARRSYRRLARRGLAWPPRPLLAR